MKSRSVSWKKGRNCKVKSAVAVTAAGRAKLFLFEFFFLSPTADLHVK